MNYSTRGNSTRGSSPGANRFRPHIPADYPPRPEASGRSDSSGSSVGKGSKGSKASGKTYSAGGAQAAASAAVGSIDNDDDDDDGDDLLAECIYSGLPKSKSEPLSLKERTRKKASSGGGGGSGGVKRREKKGDRRSTSKSPRNSRVVPGVRIPELKLKSRDKKEAAADSMPQQNDSDPPAVSAKKWASPRGGEDDLGYSMTETLTPANVGRLQEGEGGQQQQVQDQSLPARSFDLKGPVPAGLDVEGRLAVSTCSNLSSIQPPSLMMDSLVSMCGENAGRREVRVGVGGSGSGPFSMARSEQRVGSPRKAMENRRNLSGKKGHAVPEMVRRAIGAGSGGGTGSNDDLSSISSCLSNLDHIQPPTIMDDAIMDASMMSIASIKSEVADAPGEGHTRESHKLQKQHSDESNPSSDSPSLKRRLTEQSVSGTVALDDIAPPTVMDDVSAVEVTEKTLVPEAGRAVCATYTIDAAAGGSGADAGISTCQDVTDVFEDDTTIEPTATLDSDGETAPDLPRDSQHGTPVHSGGESSKEGTPRSRRRQKRIVDSGKIKYYEQYRVPTPNIDDSSENPVVQDTSGYRTESAGNSVSSRQRRKEEVDRFKTHTITKEDLTQSPRKESQTFLKKTSLARLLKQQDSGSDSSPSSSPKRSPKSVKQRREEEAERFRTRTITSSDLKPTTEGAPLSPAEAHMLEREANQVADVIEATRATARSRSASVDVLADHVGDRGRRSASIEVLGEKEMDLTMQIGGQASAESPRRGPKICKPGEAPPPPASPAKDGGGSSSEEGKAVRGRRKPLYTTPPKRSVPAAANKPSIAPKPAIAPKPKYYSSLSSPGRVGSPPTQVRGTRASNLRQSSNSVRHNSPPSPRLSSPRSFNSGYSSASSCSSRASSSRMSRQSSSTATATSRGSQPHPPLPLVRQGTFTKEDSSSNVSSEESQRLNRSPRKASPKSIRRDVVHPAGMQRAVASKPPPAASRPFQQQKGPDHRVQQKTTMQPPKFGQPRNLYARERAAARSAGPPGGDLRKHHPSTSSNGSLSSIRSAQSSNIPVPRSSDGGGGISASKSSHNLRTPNDSLAVANSSLGRRAPSSSSIDHRARNLSGPKDSGSFASAVSVDTSQNKTQDQKKTPKKEATSRIANLWKKVEDSKKKNKEKEKDPRVWITQGKVIPESELALLRPHAEQQEIISNFQQKQQAAAASTSDLKPRSKSRLSLKLSKFSKGKKDKDDRSVASPSSPTPTSEDLQIEDSINGNVVAGSTDNETNLLRQFRSSLSSPAGEQTAEYREERDVVPELVMDEDGRPKRHSRLGSFFNPESNVTTSTPATQGGENAIRFHGPSRSSAQASAIVPPFNYSPPIRQQQQLQQQQQQQQKTDAADVSPISGPSGLCQPPPVKSPLAAQVRRNDSYVSSLGRKPTKGGKEEEEDPAPAQASVEQQGRKNSAKASSSSSLMVTLV